MGFGLIIIGDEILSGKRKDQHFAKVLEILSARGLQLSWVSYLGDDPQHICATLRRTLATDDVVFSCGGIGATPDDHTRQCAADALGVPLALHPQAKQQIIERMQDVAIETGTPIDVESIEILRRLEMGKFPSGANIIVNSFNKIPGFQITGSGGGAHYFVPGFPVMAWPMIESVLDAHYAHLFNQTAWFEQSVIVYEVAESTLTPLMVEIESRFAPAKVFSLPSVGDGNTGRHIELGVKGEPESASAGFAHMLTALGAMGAHYTSPPVSS
jgi:molybdopterin-biosynthesis enzyme MoeA-like protein